MQILIFVEYESMSIADLEDTLLAPAGHVDLVVTCRTST